MLLKYYKTSLISKYILASMILFFLYLFAPFFVYENNYLDNNFYNVYLFSTNHIFLQIIDLIILLLMTFICIYLIKKIKFEFKENKLFRKVNLIIVNITVTVFIISRFDPATIIHT